MIIDGDYIILERKVERGRMGYKDIIVIRS